MHPAGSSWRGCHNIGVTKLAFLRRLALPFASFLLASSLATLAEDTTHYDEGGIAYGREYVDHHFAERIDPFSGNLSMQFVDLIIPGSAGFDLKVQRSSTPISLSCRASISRPSVADGTSTSGV